MRKMLGVIALIYLNSVAQCLSEDMRCFECNDIPHLQDCSIVRQCNTHEVCYVEQIVTTSGHVVFNSGCRDTQDCGKLTGRSIEASYNDHSNRTENQDHARTMLRRADVSVCEQCCYSDYCNNQGCNEIATPANQRGPYCFSCTRQGELQSCRHVTQCSQSQVCLIKKLLDSGLVVYDSHCIEQAQCDVIKQTYQQVFGKRSQIAAEAFPRVSFTTDTDQGLEYFVPRLERGHSMVSLCILCCETDFCNDSCIKNVGK